MALTSSSHASDAARGRWSRLRQTDLRLVEDETDENGPSDSTDALVADASPDGDLAGRLEQAEVRAAQATATMLRSKLQLMRLRRERDAVETDQRRLQQQLDANTEQFGVLQGALRELDGLWQETRIERDRARVALLRLTKQLEAEQQRNVELVDGFDQVTARSTAQVREIARIAQAEIDEAFQAGAALGERAARRVAELEHQLAQAQQQLANSVVILDDEPSGQMVR